MNQDTISWTYDIKILTGSIQAPIMNIVHIEVRT